jgi:hypothetical protein
LLLRKLFLTYTVQPIEGHSNKKTVWKLPKKRDIIFEQPLGCHRANTVNTFALLQIMHIVVHKDDNINYAVLLWAIYSAQCNLSALSVPSITYSSIKIHPCKHGTLPKISSELPELCCHWQAMTKKRHSYSLIHFKENSCSLHNILSVKDKTHKNCS